MFIERPSRDAIYKALLKRLNAVLILQQKKRYPQTGVSFSSNSKYEEELIRSIIADVLDGKTYRVHRGILRTRSGGCAVPINKALSYTEFGVKQDVQGKR